MGRYFVDLSEEQEAFLDVYLDVNPLRPGDTRQDYPGLVAKNFINSMMKRQVEFTARFEKKVKERKDKEAKDKEWEKKIKENK